MKEIIKKIEKELEPLFINENTGHDMYHLRRVYKLALLIQEKEGRGDRLVIGISALLHDIHRIIQNENRKY
ncbi:MAG: HD domain-containing protein [Candidatus Hodarchaeota archaeon]